MHKHTHTHTHMCVCVSLLLAPAAWWFCLDQGELKLDEEFQEVTFTPSSILAPSQCYAIVIQHLAWRDGLTGGARTWKGASTLR